MSDDRVFLTFDVLPDGIEAWHASYAAVCKFLTANADTYGLPSQLDDCSDEQKEMLLDVCSADPAFADIPPRTDCPPAISAGSLVIELFTKTVPKTAANFAQLCTGEKGVGKAGKPLYYKGCNVHRIAPGFCIQAGDIVKGDGSAGDSIYGLALCPASCFSARPSRCLPCCLYLHSPCPLFACFHSPHSLFLSL